MNNNVSGIIERALKYVPSGQGQTVLVGLSGGVDSSVTALLLKESGWDVATVFMRNWSEKDSSGQCTSRHDMLDAAAVSDRLRLPFDVVDFSQEYQDRVFKQFLAEYQAGRTPNPDVWCNVEIKFAALRDYAQQHNFNRLATGHYAELRRTSHGQQLLKGRDGQKDQSYFLHRLTQAQLQHALFPLARVVKSDIRQIAQAYRLPVADKKDSTGLCFIGERPFKSFLQQYLPVARGPILCVETKQVVGEHEGLHFFTLGQRKGLGIGGLKTQSGSHTPWYVVAKNMTENQLLVTNDRNHPTLYRDQITITNCHWIAEVKPETGWVFTAKTRYRQPDSACTIVTHSADDNTTVAFGQPQWAVTPGQSLVLYESRVCLGGGIITA